MLRYAAEYKDLDEPLRDFIVRRGGINVSAVLAPPFMTPDDGRVC